ncbi:MAG: pentapeptide repeat-containing protein [Cyanobacteria bacterium P01_H01_bin.152]
MIAIDYLELIEQGVEAWNRWRAEHPDELPDLESAYLFEKSLQGINFRQANLSRACLIGANLEGADLAEANLSGVYANTANLQGASLAAADLREGNFIEANLTQANLSGAVTENANFTNACLQGTCLDGWPEIVAAKPELSDPSQLNPHPTVSEARQPTIRRASPPVLPPKTVPMGLSQLAMVAGAIALTAIGLYLALRPRSEKFITSDGTVTIQLVCNEPDVTPISAAAPDHTYQNGIQFYGQFEDGKPVDGRGSMLYPNGNRYDGDYRNGQRNGCGTFTFANGRQYVGEFQNDLFSGRGIWMLENGDRYIGDFEFNKCNGEGVYIYADGTSKSGIWQQGRLVDGDLTCDSDSADLSVYHSIDLSKS